MSQPTPDGTRNLYIAGGCFWGLEELMRHQPGVIDTEVGYMGGRNEHPTYDFHPGHAETVEVVYDPTQTTAQKILDYFFRIHDPTTKHRQGNDIGSSYRSAIFYCADAELTEAKASIKRNQRHWKNPIVTELESADTFWPAEEEHQDYLQKHPGGYTCHFERVL